MTEILLGQRFYHWDGAGKAGVVTDTTFIRCFWLHFDGPVAIFADGSNGLIVEGPPTPRNIIFPEDTIFSQRNPDASNAARAAAIKASNGQRRVLVNATPEMITAYMEALADAIAKQPNTASTHSTCGDCFFFVYRHQSGRYIAELSEAEAVGIADGTIDEEALRCAKDFRLDDDETDTVYSICNDVITPPPPEPEQ